MAPRTRYARNGDVHIAFQTLGEGPIDLLWIPNAFSQIEQLQEHPTVARFFERMGHFARLIVFDRRESGMSDRTGRVPTLEEQMDDVLAVLDAAHARLPVGVFALLEGGPMAMLFSATYPDHVGALCLYSSFARTTHAEGYEWAPTKEERAARMQILIQHWGSGEDWLETLAPSHAGDETLRAWLARLQRLAMAPSMVRRFQAVNADLDVRRVLPSIRVPTLVLHREDNESFSPEHSRYLARSIPGARLVSVPGRDTLPFLGDADTVLGEIQEFFTGNRDLLDTDRVLATVLFSDIVGSTTRAAELGDARWRDKLADHDACVRKVLIRHQGREVKTLGDGFLATFDGPARAIRAGRAITREVATDVGLQVRVGLHTGECEVGRDGDVRGMAVHIAARVMEQAAPGQVLVSSTVRDLVVGSGIVFEPAGVRVLPGVPGEWSLWTVEGVR